MSVSTALVIGVLYAAGVWLLLDRQLTRIVLGVALLGHGSVLLLLSVGRTGAPPLIDAATSAADIADPLPQALALTAIVISFGVAVFLLALAVRSWHQTGDDRVPDDLEDRRVAAGAGGAP